MRRLIHASCAAAALLLTCPILAAQTAPATQPEKHSFEPGKAAYDAAAPLEVPIKFGPHGLPMVKATIDGHELPPFVLDTGAGAMVITPKTAELAGLPESGNIDASGSGATVKRATRKGGLFQLGPVKLAECTWLDLPELDGPFGKLAFGEAVGGIIGRDLFLAGVVEMDWANSRLILHEPGKLPDVPPDAWLPLEFERDLPSVRCKYEGDHEGLFMIDTGHDGGVQFEYAAVEKHKLLEGRKTTGGGLAGIGGAGARASGTIGWFELAGERHTDLPAGFATKARNDAPDRDGLIGMTLLKKYRIIMDAARARVAFIPIRPQ